MMGERAAELDGNARGGDPYHFGRVERGTSHAVEITEWQRGVG